MREFSVVGQRILRIDDPALARGQARFTADLALPGMLYSKILRSPHPHARILNIDTSKALKLPGVKVVLTGEDVTSRF